MAVEGVHAAADIALQAIGRGGAEWRPGAFRYGRFGHGSPCLGVRDIAYMGYGLSARRLDLAHDGFGFCAVAAHIH